MAEMIKFRVGIGAQLNAKDIENQLKSQKSEVIEQVRKSLEKGEKPKIDFGFDIDKNSGISDADAKKFKSQCEKQINNLIDSIMKSFGDQMASSITNELTKTIEDLFDKLGQTMINSFESMKNDVVNSLSGKPIQINTSDMIDIKSDKGKTASQVKKVISDNVKAIDDEANKAYKKLFSRSIKFDGKSFTDKYVEKLRGNEKDLDKISKNFFSTVEKVAKEYYKFKNQLDEINNNQAVLTIDTDDYQDVDKFEKLYNIVKKTPKKKLKSEITSFIEENGDIEDIDNIIKKASKATSFDDFVKLANSASEELAASNEKINQQVNDLQEILARLEYAYRKKWTSENEIQSIFDMKKYFEIDTSELRSASEAAINRILDENDRISLELQKAVQSGELLNEEPDLMNFDIKTLKKNILNAVKEIRKNIKPIELPFTPEPESLGNFAETVLNKVHDVFDESIPVKAKLINEDELREQLKEISGLSINVNANINGVAQSDTVSTSTLPSSNQNFGIKRISEDDVLSGIPIEDLMNAMNDSEEDYYDNLAKFNDELDESSENIVQMVKDTNEFAESFTHVETKAKEVKKTASEIADILLKNAGVENISTINQPLEDAKEELEILKDIERVNDLRRKKNTIPVTEEEKELLYSDVKNKVKRDLTDDQNKRLANLQEERKEREKLVQQWHELSKAIEPASTAVREYEAIQEKLAQQKRYEDTLSKGLFLQPNEQQKYDELKAQNLEEALVAQEKVVESAKQELEVRKQESELFAKYSVGALIGSYQKVNSNLSKGNVVKIALENTQKSETIDYSSQSIINKAKNKANQLTDYERSYSKSIKEGSIKKHLEDLEEAEKIWSLINKNVSEGGINNGNSYFEYRINDLSKSIKDKNNKIKAAKLSGSDYSELEGSRNALESDLITIKSYYKQYQEIVNSAETSGGNSEEIVKKYIRTLSEKTTEEREHYQAAINDRKNINLELDGLRHKDIKSQQDYLDAKEKIDKLLVGNSSYQRQIEEKTLEYSSKTLNELQKQAKQIASEQKKSSKEIQKINNNKTKQELAKYIAEHEVKSGSKAGGTSAKLKRLQQQITNYEADMNEIYRLVNEISKDPNSSRATELKKALEILIERAGTDELGIQGWKVYQDNQKKKSQNKADIKVNISDYKKGTSSIQEVVDNLDKDIKEIEQKNSQLNSSLSSLKDIATQKRNVIAKKVYESAKTANEDIENLKKEITNLKTIVDETGDESLNKELRGKIGQLKAKQDIQNEFDRERKIDTIYAKDNEQLIENIKHRETELYINNQKLEQLKAIREEQEKIRKEQEPTVADIKEQKSKSTKDYSLQKKNLTNQLTSMQNNLSELEEQFINIIDNVENNILELQKKKEEQQKLLSKLISGRNTDVASNQKFVPNIDNIESAYLEEYHRYLSSTADFANTEYFNRQKSLDSQKELNNLINKYNVQDENTLKIEIKKQIAVAKLLELYEKIEEEQKSIFKDNNLLTSYISEMENIASEIGIDPGKTTKFGQSYNYDFRKGYKSTLNAMHSGSLSKMSVNELETLLSTIDNLTSEKKAVITKADILSDTYQRIVNELSFQLSNINNELLGLDEKINGNKDKLTESLKKSLLESSQKNSDFISKNLGDTDEAKQNLVTILNLTDKLYKVTNKNGKKNANTTKFLNSIGISKDDLKQAQDLVSIGITGSDTGFKEENNLEVLEKQRKLLLSQRVSIESELVERKNLLTQQQSDAQILRHDLEIIRQKYVEILKAKLKEQQIKFNSNDIEEQKQALVNILELTKQLKSVAGVKSSDSILSDLGVDSTIIKRAEDLIREQNAAEKNRAISQKSYDVKKDAEISKQKAVVDSIEDQINHEKDKINVGQKQIQIQKELVDAKQSEIDALKKAHKVELKSFNDKEKEIINLQHSSVETESSTINESINKSKEELKEVEVQAKDIEQTVEKLTESNKKFDIRALTGEQKTAIGKILDDIDVSNSSAYVSESDNIIKELVRLNEEFDGQLVQLIRDKCQSVLEYTKKSTDKNEVVSNKQWIDKMRQSIIPVIEATLAYQGLSPELQQKINEKDNDLDSVIQTWILSKLNGVLESETLFNKGKNVTGIQIGGKDFSRASADKYDTWFQTHADGMGIFSPSDFNRLESDWKKGLRKFQLLVDGSLHEIDFSGIKKAPKTIALQFVKEYESEYKKLTKGLNTIEEAVAAKNQAFTNIISRDTFSEIKYTIQENYIDTMKKAGKVAEQVSEEIAKSNKKINENVDKTSSVVNNTSLSSHTSNSNIPTDINIIGISNTSGLATEEMQKEILGAINGTIKVTGDVNITGGNINIGDNNNIRMNNPTSPTNSSTNSTLPDNTSIVESIPIDIDSQHNADLLNDAVRETMKKVTVPNIDSKIVIDEEKSRLALQSASKDIIKDMQNRKGHITKVEFLTDNVWKGESIVNGAGKVIEEKITGYQKLTNAVVTYKNAANETIRSMYTLQKVILPRFDEKGNPIWKKDNKGNELIGQQDFTITEIFAQDSEKLLKQGDSANKVIEKRNSLISKYDRALDTIASRAKDKAISKPLSDDSLNKINDVIQTIRTEIEQLGDFDNINQINEQIIKIEKSMNNLRNSERELRNQDNVTSFRSRSDIDSYNIAQSKIMGIEAEINATGISSKKLINALTEAKVIMGESFGSQTASDIQKVDDLIAAINAEIQALKKVQKQKDIKKSNVKETYNEIMSLIQVITKAEDAIDNLNAQKIKNPLLVNDSELEKQAQIIFDAYRKLNSLDHNAFIYKSKKSKYISQDEYDAYTFAYSQRGGTLDKSSDAKKTMANKEAIQREKIANSILNEEIKTVERLSNLHTEMQNRIAQGKDIEVIKEKIALEQIYLKQLKEEILHYSDTDVARSSFGKLKDIGKKSSLKVKQAYVDANLAKNVLETKENNNVRQREYQAVLRDYELGWKQFYKIQGEMRKANPNSFIYEQMEIELDQLFQKQMQLYNKAVSFDDIIKTVRDDLIAIDNKLELSGQGTYKVAKASAEARDSVISDLDKKIENYNQKLFNFDVVAQRADTIIPSSLTEKLDEIRNQMTKIQELKNIIGDKNKFLNEEDLQNSKTELNDIYLYIEKIFTTISKDNAYKEVKTTAIEKLDLKMSDWLKTNTIASEFRNTIIQLREDLKNVSSDADIKKISEEFMIAERKAKDAGKEGKNFFDLIITKSKHLSAQFLGQYFSLMDIIRYLRTGFETIKELDTTLTEMRKVSDESVKSLKSYQFETFDIANEIGSTAIAVQNSTADWMRLGESMKDAAQSAKDTTILFNVSEFESIDEATKALTSASQAYSELDKMQIVDKLNELGNTTSSSTTEYAQGLQNAAAVLKTQGNDINEALAMLSAGNAITQDMDKTSAGIRTIALRIAGTKEAKQELEDLGESVDDYVVQTASKTDEIIRKYTAVASNHGKGISVLDNNGNLRSTYDILLDISKIYSEIQEEDKKFGTNRANALVEVLAGKNRSNIAASILSNTELLETAYESSVGADGSALKENEKYLESIEAKLQKLTTQTQEFWATFINSDAIKFGIDSLTQLLSLITDLVDNLGFLGTIGLGATGILGAKGLGFVDIFKNMTTPKITNQAVDAFKIISTIPANANVNWNEWTKTLGYTDKTLLKFLNTTKGSERTFENYQKYINGANKTTGMFAAKLKTVAANVGIMLAITAAVKIATAIWDKFDTTVGEAQSDLDETQGTIKSLKEQIKELEGLDANSLTQGQKDKLENLKEQLKVQEQLEEIEKRRLAREVIGNGNFADYFDKDSYKNNKRKLHNVTEDASYNLNSISGTFTSRQAYISSLNDQLKNTDGLNKEQIERLENSLLEANRQQSISRETILGIQESLIANKLDIQNWMSQIQTYIDEGYIVGADLTRANEILKELQILLNGTNDEIERTNTLLYGGDDSIESVIAEKTKYTYQNLLDNGFTKDEIEILSTLTFDKNATLKELRTILEEAQKKANENPVEPEVKFSKSQMIDAINSMSDGFDVLDDIYADVFDKGSFDFTKLDSKKFSEAFKGLEEEYNSFIETVSSSPTDINACQDAFNELAAAFIDNKGILKNLTEENANLATAMLRNMGIENAEEIVTAQLAIKTEGLALQKQFVAEKNRELTEATYEEINGFLQESTASDEAKFALVQLAIAKIDCNNASIDSSSDIENLLAIAKTAGFTSEQLLKLEGIKSRWQHQIDIGNTGGAELLESQYKKTLAEVQSDIANFNPVVDIKTKMPSKYTGGDKTSDTKLKEAEDAAKEATDSIVDFFERRVEVLEQAFGNLEAGIQNVLGAKAKNTVLAGQLEILDEETRNYTAAIGMYQEAAESYLSLIPEAYREAAKNGDISILQINDEQTREAIENYQQWANKVAECTQKLEELKAQIRELELEKFNNIIKDFTDQFDLHGTAIDNIDKQIGLLEEAGELIGSSYYTKQIEQSEKQLALLEQQKLAMVEQLNDSLSSGRIQTGTDEWLEMVNALQEVEGNILDCKTSIEEFNNALLEIQWIVFERIQTEFGNLNSEMENLAGLFNDFNDIEVSDGKGTWTKEAIATLGLYAQQYELARYQANQYGEAIEKLKQDYLEGKYSATEYMDKLSELSQGQWDAINSAESLEDAIISLNETRVNEEIEAYRELIDAQIELIEQTDKLKKKQDELAEKSKTVADIEKQLAAMMYDNSAATVAKRKQLEAQLAEAKKDLSDTEYEYSKEAQIDALNKQFEDQETLLQESLKDRETLLNQSFNIVKENATLVGEQITLIAQQHGVIVSDAVITPWLNGETAIAGYGETLSAQSSVFIGNLIGVENEVIELQNNANVTSVALSNMFATRADNLVGQLRASWYEENNLNYATSLLHQNLLDTLQGSYNVSGIVGALNAIKAAADAASKSLRDMQYTQSSSSKQYYTVGAYFDGKNNKKSYYIQDIYSGETVGSFGSYEEALKEWEKNYKNKNYNIKKYAKGGIVSKEYKGMFDPIAKSIGEDTMVAVKHGEGILTPVQTEGLLKLAPLLESFKNSSATHNLMNQNNLPVAIKNERPNITLHYDKMFEFNGDFNNSEQLLNQMKNVASKVTTKVLNDINRDFRIHSR